MERAVAPGTSLWLRISGMKIGMCCNFVVEAKVGVDMDRLAASKSAPGQKGKARGEI